MGIFTDMTNMETHTGYGAAHPETIGPNATRARVLLAKVVRVASLVGQNISNPRMSDVLCM
jgi:hypothetical protein